LLEVFVLLLVIAVLTSVALPLYLNTVSETEKKTCRGNLQTITYCVEAARLASGAIDYGDLIAGGVTRTNLPRLLEQPVCPSGGSYNLAMGNTGAPDTFKVQCSFAGHGAFQPGVDVY
jgi:type II secretory pathway pseudopilin PulG